MDFYSGRHSAIFIDGEETEVSIGFYLVIIAPMSTT